MKNLILAILLFTFFMSFCNAQEQNIDSTQKIRKLMFLVDAGVIATENLIGNPGESIGFNLGIKAYYKPWKVGLRLRREYWHKFDKFIVDYYATYHNTKSMAVDNYEISALEGYKTFTSLGDFSLGGGLSLIYPYALYRYGHATTLFISKPIHWFTIELRAQIPFKGEGGIGSTNGGLGSMSESFVRYGRLNLSAYYTFPSKYPTKKKQTSL